MTIRACISVASFVDAMMWKDPDAFCVTNLTNNFPATLLHHSLILNVIYHFRSTMISPFSFPFIAYKCHFIVDITAFVHLFIQLSSPIHSIDAPFLPHT